MIDFGKKRNETFLVETIHENMYLLDSAVEWIRDNLEVDDVFTENQLREWAIDYGFKEE